MANDPLSLTFAALADPTRRAILVRLAEGEATVNEVAEPFDMSLQAVSKHLKVLEGAGFDLSRPRRAVPTVSFRIGTSGSGHGLDCQKPTDLDRAIRPARSTPEERMAHGKEEKKKK